jgi:hypothetical protein
MSLSRAIGSSLVYSGIIYNYVMERKLFFDKNFSNLEILKHHIKNADEILSSKLQLKRNVNSIHENLFLVCILQYSKEENKQNMTSL